MASYRKKEAREWAREHLRGVANVVIPSYTKFDDATRLYWQLRPARKANTAANANIPFTQRRIR